MAQLVTLARVREDAHFYADQRSGTTFSDFSTPTETDRLINQVLRRWYDLLVAARGHDLYTKTTEGGGDQTVANTQSYALPADFYQLRGVELHWSATDIEEVPEIPLNERNAYRRYATWARYAPKGYTLLTDKLRLLPTPTTVTDYALLYIPVAPTLAGDNDTFDGVNGWEKFVALGVALELRAAEQSDASDIAALFSSERERLEELAAQRDASQVKRVRDTQPRYTYWPWPRTL